MTDSQIILLRQQLDLLEIDLFGMLKIDLEGKILQTNRSLDFLLGYSNKELLDRYIGKMLTKEEDRTQLTQELAKLSKDELQTLWWFGTFKTKDQGDVDLHISWTYCRNTFSGVVIRSDNKVMLPPTQESANSKDNDTDLFRLMAENAYDIIIVFNSDGKILYMNPQAALLVTSKAKLDINITEILSSEQIFWLRKIIDPVDQDQNQPIFYETDLKYSENIIPVEISATRFKSPEGDKNFLIVARNISRRKELALAFAKEEKSEAIVTFASGVVHDLLDFLTNILNNIDAVQTKIKPEESEPLNKIKLACEQTRKLARSLTYISGGRPPVKTIGSPVKIITSVSKYILKASKIKSEFVVAPDLWMVEFDESDLKQVIRHIIMNTRENMTAGVLKIFFSNLTIQENDIKNPFMKSGDYIKISIHDQGIGITAEHLSRIFDPYFSTQKIGTKQGMGLGLSIAYFIIRNHLGYIKASSELGEGTRIDIYLPAFRKDRRKKYRKIEKYSHGRILIMDDEEIGRAVVGQMLQELNYDTTFSDNGAETIVKYEEAIKDSPFSAVLLDLNIKDGLGGTATIEKLLALDPDVKAIVCSAYANDPEILDYTNYGFCASLDKPYRLQELSETLKKVLK